MEGEMKVGERGLALVKQFEGFRAYPYYDSVKVATIGYGATYYPDGERVRITDKPITEAQASDLLIVMLDDFADAIADALNVGVTQSQFDALVCWAYNVGIKAATGSTLMRLLNAGDVQGAADQFLRWNRAGGQVLPGLTRRREAERALFLEDA